MSRFVSGGTNDEPTERDEAWLQAQQALEAKRQQEAQASKQDDGKSLYDKLQENKAAKQDAFEESMRLRNQFRSLDEDEADFLDSVLESTRAKEEEVRKQQTEQLGAFRKQQEEVEKASKQQDDPDTVEVSEAWSSTSRKRKKGRESGIGGVKIRRTSTAERTAEGAASPVHSDASPVPPERRASASKVDVKPMQPVNESTPSRSETGGPPVSTAPPNGLGLVAYSSDEDE